MKKIKLNKMKRIDVEHLRDVIRSQYDIDIDYDEYEQEVMKWLEYGYITQEEFEAELNKLYQELVKASN